MFLATGPDSTRVVVRTFTLPLTDSQSEGLAAALTDLCRRPLEHPSIARPLSSGVEDGQPYLVHALLPGSSLADLARGGRLAASEAVVRLTSLAGALDFAAATGVLHGALTPQDVTFSASNAGVSGFGLVQALQSAGVPGFRAERQDDVRALMGIAREMLGDQVSPAVASVLAGPPAPTALAFAAALRESLPTDTPAVLPIDLPGSAEITRPFPTRPADEGLGRLEFDQEASVPAIEDLFHREPAPAVPLDFEFRREAPAPPFADQLQAEPDEIPIPEPDPPPLAGDAGPTDPPPMFGTDVPLTMFGATGMEPQLPKSRGRSIKWVIVGIIALGLGGFAGFAGGFFVGHDGPELPGVAVAPPAPTPPPASAPPSAPAGTGGQNFTDAAVDDPAAPAPAPPGSSASQNSAAAAAGTAPSPPAAPTAPAGRSASTPEPPARPATGRTTPRSSRVPAPVARPSGPAAMLVDSRPAGAQVFVDGRSVGYTPIVVGDLSPGTHSVRMEIPGYRPWVTAVTLSPGARERVAASLEQ